MDRFRYNLNTKAMNDEESEQPKWTLEIHVHNARNIHNICIYDNQDVYAKFSLTYDPDDTISTTIINGGGKNPNFNQTLTINNITNLEALLKCEIWMLSRVRNYLEDQLLGFTLVPISDLVGKSTKLTKEYSLSSTDLFHSPAGTVKLTLSLNPKASDLEESGSEVEREVCDVALGLDLDLDLDPGEYGRIEFPDIGVVRENQLMVSEYFDMAAKPVIESVTDTSTDSGMGLGAEFLKLGAGVEYDYEMGGNSSEELATTSRPSYNVKILSPNNEMAANSSQNSGLFSSTMTSLSEDRSSGDSMEKKSPCDTPTSNKASEESKKSDKSGESPEFGKVFTGPLGGVDMEAEQSAMQKQIVDMYMRSMQQFTESLANMKLPMELDKAESRQDSEGELAIQSRNGGNNKKLEIEKKDGSRVFYGSRAFF